MFDDYAYFSSSSAPLVRQAEELYHLIARTRRPARDGLIVEIGSNDGYLLDVYRRHGHPVLGVEPARNLAKHACDAGIATLAEFFSAKLARELRRQHGSATVIHASNVLAHVPEITDVLAGVRDLLDEAEGVIVIETPSVVELIRRGLFDTIYHEHIYYYSFTALNRLLADAGLRSLAVETVPAHGGSLRVVAGHRGTADSSVERQLRAEDLAGVGDGSIYATFSDRVDRFLQLLETELIMLSDQGSVAGIGAAAKTGIVLNSVSAKLAFVCDSTPYKQGGFIPGTAVPVVPPEQLLAKRPRYCFIFPWNYADAIIEANLDYLRAGGVFVKASDFTITQISADSQGTITESVRATAPPATDGAPAGR